MRCPNCDEQVDLEDWDDEPFQTPCCETWVRLDVDEGTYLGARHETLVALCDLDIEFHNETARAGIQRRSPHTSVRFFGENAE